MMSRCSLSLTVAVMATTFVIAMCTEKKGTVFHLTCGVGNPDLEYGHNGLVVKETLRTVDDVRVCTNEFQAPGLHTYYIRVEINNTTASGLPCDSSRQLFIGEAKEGATLERVCGPGTFSKTYPAGVTLQLKGDTGADVSELATYFWLHEVEYLTTCNSNMYDHSDALVIDKTFQPDVYLFLPYNCYWKFVAPKGNNDRMMMHLHSVDLKGPNYDSLGCQNNKLTVIDGWKETQTKLFESCDNSTELTFITSQTAILVKVLITEPSKIEPLSFNFTLVPLSGTECYGQVLTLKASSDDKYFNSPGYPNELYGTMNCQWKIESEDGNQVEIEIEDLDLTDYDCENDRLKVYDGPDQTSMVLSELCGDLSEKKKYRSSAKVFLVRLVSNDYNTNGRGIKIRYYTKADPSPDLVPDTKCRWNTVHLEATSERKQLTSLNYPNNYPVNSNCNWMLESDNDNIEVEILELQVEESALCFRDSLDIYGDDDGNKSPLASVCGDLNSLTTGKKFRSFGQSMLIHFKSDYNHAGKGFKLEYYTRASPSPDLATVNSCRGKIVYLNSTEEPQNLTSPGFPASYDPNSDCRWQIKADPDKTVKVEVTSLQMESSNKNDFCVSDYVRIFDGHIGSSSATQRLCTWTKTVEFESTGRYLTILFRSDGDTGGQGFSIKYYTPVVSPTDPTVTRGPGNNSPDQKAASLSLIITFVSALLTLVTACAY